MASVVAGAAQAAPHRVVSTNLCADEYVFRLVPRQDIAALTILAGAKDPVVSTISDEVNGIRLIRPGAETVLSLKPDLVVYFQGAETRLLAQIHHAGIPTIEIPYANSLADIRRVTLQAGRRLGNGQGARRMVAAMDATLARAQAQAPHPPVRALIYEPNGYLTSGTVSDALMRLGGLKDAVPSGMVTRSGTLPIEAVLAANPQLLILNAKADEAGSRGDLVLRHPALRALQAHADIVWMPLTPLLCAGPWSAQAALDFARLGQQARGLARARAAH